ncbi:MAG: hypothetical protein NUW21_09955 [Elusimicrobia bacterium]|nr:hypothetical protein [Elusimicrobiota bacterium]
MNINELALRILAALAMSAAMTGCVGYVRDGREPVVYVSGGYYYGSYYDGGYYRHYDRRGYDSRYVYYVPAPARAPQSSPDIAPAVGVKVAPGSLKRRKR